MKIILNLQVSPPKNCNLIYFVTILRSLTKISCNLLFLVYFQVLKYTSSLAEEFQQDRMVIVVPSVKILEHISQEK